MLFITHTCHQWFWTILLLVCYFEGRCNCYTAEIGSNSIEANKEGGCPIAFHKIGAKCYFYGYFKLNWFRAMEFCHSFGESVSLACIETQEENEHLKEWLIANGDHTTGVWVGGSDNGHVGRWAWFPTGQLIQHFNWGPSQPNGGDQHCMYIVGGYLGYQWADFHCGFEMTFLCEYKVNEVEAWRRRRLMDPNLLLQQRKLSSPISIDSATPNLEENSVNIRYGFKNNTLNKVPKSVVVTQKPLRNSVLISTSKTSTTITKQIVEKSTNQTTSENWKLYNFLKSIVG